MNYDARQTKAIPGFLNFPGWSGKVEVEKLQPEPDLCFFIGLDLGGGGVCSVYILMPTYNLSQSQCCLT